ncbi:hypothetical protein FF80_03221 [Devosia sp. LC5]|uniref:hypothetical protein n=1 Tax=Devosia sp. LC5 TaxID=1502724 RepID=UPI0004E2B6A2|nr:hypothetical protein [Devosia sp. LC5]KFC63496.1 hypothetical protein FF80_03221 [Devosia sp. LC5]
MTFTLRTLSLATIAAFTFAAAPGFAQDAMAPAGGAMAPAGDAMAPAGAMDAMGPMTPISDADFKLCSEQAATMTFPEAMQAAMAACHGLHQGMDVMGTIKSMGMETDAMAPAAQ